jgi:ribosomal RNA assembly protein
MSFEKLIRIPTDRIGALIGKSGQVKEKIEKICHVELEIDSESGETIIRSQGKIEDIQPFKAMEIVTAIGRGFSPDNALRLLKGENTLHVIDLRSLEQNLLHKLKG